ncbi:MAG TPA: response regulator [Burkholderiales bacterium]|jgi:CheY-like chemotaxis protein
MTEARSKRLLVADDDADMRLTLKLALEIAGYAVDVAANAREALALQRGQPADVLITDIFMPDADGFEAIDAFRHEFPRTRIIVVSGGAQFTKRDYLPDAELIGVDATLQKPFDIDTLLATLRSLQ